MNTNTNNVRTCGICFRQLAVTDVLIKQPLGGPPKAIPVCFTCRRKLSNRWLGR